MIKKSELDRIRLKIFNAMQQKQNPILILTEDENATLEKAKTEGVE